MAVRLDPGPEWLGLIEAIWAAAAALLPLDHRLSHQSIEEQLAFARPTVVVDPGGGARLDEGRRVDPGVALVVATSGTAGQPKLVQLSRDAVEAAMASSALALEATPADGWLCCLPLGHIGGLLVLLRSVLLGAPVTIHPGFDPEAIRAHRGPVFTSLVPTMLLRLLDAGVDLGGYRAILVGGGPLPSALRGRAEREGVRIVETYGLTESCGGVVYDGLPLPGVQMRVGPAGSVQLAGRMLMLGYRFDPGATAQAFTQDGWLETRDAGELDAEGRLRILGRVDGVIVSGGEKVWPEEIEAVLREHPAVREVAVSGRLDPVWGQRVVAWVVPDEGAPVPTLEDLRDFGAGRTARYRLPRELVLVEELPTTPLGKVRRGEVPE